MIEPAEVRVKVGPYGLTGLIVNGEDWTSHTKAVQIVAEDSAVPVVNVSVIPEPFEYDGIGVVVVQEHSDPKEIIHNFLSRVDPQILEAMALEKSGWGSDSIGKQILDTLLAMVDDD